MNKTFIILFLVCTLGLSASAQVAPAPTTLVPGQPVEREIAGGRVAYLSDYASGGAVRARRG